MNRIFYVYFHFHLLFVGAYVWVSVQVFTTSFNTHTPCWDMPNFQLFAFKTFREKQTEREREGELWICWSDNAGDTHTLFLYQLCTVDQKRKRERRCEWVCAATCVHLSNFWADHRSFSSFHCVHSAYAAAVEIKYIYFISYLTWLEAVEERKKP